VVSLFLRIATAVALSQLCPLACSEKRAGAAQKKSPGSSDAGHDQDVIQDTMQRWLPRLLLLLVLGTAMLASIGTIG